jgi:hypothetical protein
LEIGKYAVLLQLSARLDLSAAKRLIPAELITSFKPFRSLS